MPKVTADQVRKKAREGALERNEEMVLRMRTGANEAGDHELEFRGQGRALTRMRLAQMEKGACEKLGYPTSSRPRKPRVRQGV